jgi:hypothetical protein
MRRDLGQDDLGRLVVDAEDGLAIGERARRIIADLRLPARGRAGEDRAVRCREGLERNIGRLVAADIDYPHANALLAPRAGDRLNGLIPSALA